MSDTGESGSTDRPQWSRLFTSEPILVALMTAVIGVIIGGSTIWMTAVGKDRELDIKYVEIGIAILRADPKDENAAKIRQWAIDIVDQYSSKRKFTAEERAHLLESAIKTKGYDFGGDGYFGDSLGTYSNDPERKDRKNPDPAKPPK